MQILITWNIRLLESITFNPQQLNEISSVLNTNTLPAEGKRGKSRSTISKSFRANKNTSVKDQDIRRADSFPSAVPTWEGVALPPHRGVASGWAGSPRSPADHGALTTRRD